jgi:hypothetical protein
MMGLDTWAKFKLQELQKKPLNSYNVAEELYINKENYG